MKNILIIISAIIITACGGSGGSNSTPAPPANAAPTITDIDVQTFDEQTDYSLTVTASDSDGNIASYVWTQLSGDTLTLTNTDTATVNISTSDISTDSSGQLQIIVTDDDGATASTTVDYTVVANLTPTANFSFQCLKTECTFSNTSTDTDGEIASQQWSFGDGQISVLAEPSNAFAEFGSYSVALTVVDNDGDSSTKTTTITLLDYKQPSYITRKYYSYKDYSALVHDIAGGALEAVMLDYNNDGYLDIIHTNSDYGASFEGNAVAARRKMQFFKGNSAGELEVDEQLSNKLDGLEHGRKGIVGDFNDDGYPDIFFAGHGIDIAPFPGEYPILLLNDNGNGFTEIRFTDLIGFFHSATSGDYDNDNDLDIVLISGYSYLLKNDGNGNFEILAKTSRESENFVIEDFIPNTRGVFTTELFDLNKDGFLDLITTGHDWSKDYNSPSTIFFGNGSNFNSSSLLLPSAFGYGVCIDMDFIDINQDGNYEIIFNRTGDPDDGLGFYTGWYVQILELGAVTYIDSTEEYISDNVGETGGWMYWLQIDDYDNDGVLELFNDDLDPNPSHLAREWELLEGKFVRTE